MKEIFCKIRDNNFLDGEFYVHTDGTLEFIAPFPDDAPPENLEIWEGLRRMREELAQDRVASMKNEIPHVAILTRGYRSRFPEAFATLCAFMRQGPPFEPDEEEEYDEDDEILQYTVVPRVENPWEDDPDFDPAVVY